MGDNPRLLVAPQFPLYTMPATDDHETEGDEDVDEDIPEDEEEMEGGSEWLVATVDPPTADHSAPRNFLAQEEDDSEMLADVTISTSSTFPAPQDLLAQEEDDLEVLADVSFSTASTSPGYKAMTRLADSAILHVTSEPNRALPSRYQGYRVNGLVVPLLFSVGSATGIPVFTTNAMKCGMPLARWLVVFRTS